MHNHPSSTVPLIHPTHTQTYPTFVHCSRGRWCAAQIIHSTEVLYMIRHDAVVSEHTNISAPAGRVAFNRDVVDSGRQADGH